VAEESVRPPPKSEGHAGYIGAAVVMLLVGGGLIYWKVNSKPPPPPQVVPPTASAAETEEPYLDAPPPPPPPPEEDAGPDDAGADGDPGQRRALGRLPDPCKQPCAGKETGPLLSAVRAKAAQARTCYERALRQNATLEGRMTVSAMVGSNGTVCSASVGGDSLGDPAVASCVLQQFRAGAYPPPQGGCVTVRVPLNFVPKK